MYQFILLLDLEVETFYIIIREMKSMINSISFCKEMGCKGIVIGVLDKKNDIDIKKCNELIKNASWYVFNFSYGV